MQKTILVIGTLDTKEELVLFLKSKIENKGHRALIMDTGVMRPPCTTPDVSRQEVALAGGRDIEELLAASDKGACIANMMSGAAKTATQLYNRRAFDGVIGIGGAQGAAIGSAAMKALPLGVPKLLVTTVASGRAEFGPFVGTTDVTVMHSVVDMLGINSISARILDNAAGAIVGMVEAFEKISFSEKPRVALSVLGNTTPAGMKARELLEKQGYEIISFHCNGTGGIAMEQLISKGFFDAVLDLTTHEIIDREFGGIHGAIENNRLQAAGKAGIGQVVVPGCIDYIVFGPLESVPAPFQDRPYIIHNPRITLVRADRKQMERAAEIIVERLNKASGPAAVAVPTRGLSMHNIEGEPFFDPETDAACRHILKEKLRPDIIVHEIDAHINDPEFAESIVELLVNIQNKPVNREQ